MSNLQYPRNLEDNMKSTTERHGLRDEWNRTFLVDRD